MEWRDRRFASAAHRLRCAPNRAGVHAAARILFRAQRSRLTLGSGAWDGTLPFRCAAGPTIKSAVPAWGDRDCLTACIRGPENTRRRNYNRAGVMRGGMPCVRLHAWRAAPTEPPSITLAKVFLQKSLRIGRRAGAAGGHSARARSPRRSQFPDLLAGFNPVVRADNAGAHVQPREQPRGVTRATRAPSSPARSPARRRTRGSRASSRRCSHRRSARCGPCRRTRRRPESAAPHRRAIRSRRGSP